MLNSVKLILEVKTWLLIVSFGCVMFGKLELSLLVVGLLLVGADVGSGLKVVDDSHEHEDGNYGHSPYQSDKNNELDSCGGHVNYKTGHYHYHEMPRC